MARRNRRAPKRRARRVRRARKGMSRSQTAHIVETVEIPFGNNARTSGTANQLFNRTFLLSMFPRATLVAPNFKLFRAKKVKWTYTPLNNTYQQQFVAAANVAIPQFFSVMNRTQDSDYEGQGQFTALASLEAMGATARLFTKKIVIEYRPNWNASGQTIVTGGTGGVTSANFLTTGYTPSYRMVACPDWQLSGVTQTGGSGFIPDLGDVPGATIQTYPAVNGMYCVWNGHLDFVHQIGAIPAEQLYTLECTVEWEFAKPNFIIPGGREPPPVEEVAN